MYRRGITPRIIESLGDTPVILIHGARQAGKTTLVRELAQHHKPARYVTLDDPAQRAAASADPQGFLAAFDGSVAIDEVQRVPELAVAIKAEVDRLRTPGRFILTGSANVLQVPRLSDSLAGRMEIHRLWPLSQGELGGAADSFVDTLLSDAPLPMETPGESRDALLERIVRGGYPEAVVRQEGHRRRAWFASYLDTILERDVRDLANIESLATMPRILALLSSRAGALLNYAALSRDLGIPQSTLKRYLTLLETIFLIHRVPPWFNNLGLRVVKSPKLYVSDSGLLAHAINADVERIAADGLLMGRAVENFAVGELRRQADWGRSRPGFFHYRSPAGAEVDVVMEGPGGRIVGVEIKAAATLNADDFNGLARLSKEVGRRFHRGVILYTGTTSVSFGPGLHAVPLPTLWTHG